MLRRGRHDEGLRRVYRDHVDAVFAFFSYSVDRSAAEDLTSATFERVVRHWRRYDAAQASERTWILTIARNALIDHHRRGAARPTTSLDAHPLLAASLAAGDDPTARVLDAAGFAGWLDALGDRGRQVLALRFGADLTGAEVAQVLGLSEANVHQITSRSLKALRAQADAKRGDGTA